MTLRKRDKQIHWLHFLTRAKKDLIESEFIDVYYDNGNPNTVQCYGPEIVSNHIYLPHHSIRSSPSSLEKISQPKPSRYYTLQFVLGNIEGLIWKYPADTFYKCRLQTIQSNFDQCTCAEINSLLVPSGSR